MNCMMIRFLVGYDLVIGSLSIDYLYIFISRNLKTAHHEMNLNCLDLSRSTSKKKTFAISGSGLLRSIFILAYVLPVAGLYENALKRAS